MSERQTERNRKAVKIWFHTARSCPMASLARPGQVEHPPLGCHEDPAPGRQRAAGGSKKGPSGVHVRPGGHFFPTCSLRVATSSMDTYSWSICISHRRGMQVGAKNPGEGACAQNPHNL